MADEIFIQHRFTLVQNGASLSDALILPIADYQSLKQADIDTLKQQRFTSWKYQLDNPPVIVEPSIDVKYQIVTDQITELTKQKVLLESQGAKVVGGGK